MKSIIKTLVISALALTGLSACTGDQALPPINKPEGLGEAKLGNGAWNTPMAAYQAAIGTIPHDDYGYDMSEAWVTGYIVGWVNVDISNSNLALAADFTVPAKVATNIMIASRPDETDPAYIATVQLPSGEIRNALNLLDHPENLGSEVTVYGTVGIKYCGQYGVRTVTDYLWGDQGKEPDPNMVMPAGAREVVKWDFTKGLNGVTFDQGEPSQANFEIWKYSSQYGLVATGGKTPAVTSDAWAITSEIDLTAYNQPRMMLHQAANFFNNADNFRQMTSVMAREVKEDGTRGEWSELELPYTPSGSSWTFGDSGYIPLDDFAGKKIEIGFNYTSISTLSGTWEIDRLTIVGVRKK